MHRKPDENFDQFLNSLLLRGVSSSTVSVDGAGTSLDPFVVLDDDDDDVSTSVDVDGVIEIL